MTSNRVLIRTDGKVLVRGEHEVMSAECESSVATELISLRQALKQIALNFDSVHEDSLSRAESNIVKILVTEDVLCIANVHGERVVKLV